MEKGPFKLKGFSGFGDGTSPLKNIATSKAKTITPDAVLVEAAGKMNKEKLNPYIYQSGMAALGFIDGLSKIKPKTQSDADEEQQEKEKEVKKEKREKKKKEKKKEKEKKPVITVEPPTPVEIDGKDVKGKNIIQRIFKRKKK